MENESVDDSRLSSAEESVQKIRNELVQCLENSMEKLQKVWNEIGISDEQKGERTQVVLQHLQNLLNEMVDEEIELKTSLLGNVATCTEEMIRISKELGIPCFIPEEVSILKKEKELRTRVNDLKMEKHERLKLLKGFRTKEKELCDRLCLPAHNIGEKEVPTKEDLRELEANLEYLQNEMAKRLENFKKIRDAICGLWEELEMEPGAEIERQMIKGNADESFKLSSDNLAVLKALQKELEMQQKDNIQTVAKLREQVEALWVKLDVDKSERVAFLSHHVGIKKSVIIGFREEIERLQKLKMQHLQKFIDGLRKELHALWDKCYFGTEQRAEFTPIFSENYTEELLSMHEHQVEAVRNFYEENKELYKLVEKRENMFKKMEEFENKAHDVSRFANRGGQLLKEEKMRKALKKELPKIEKELKSLIEVWERENERPFFVNGNKYLDIVNNQWSSFKAHKEQEKQDRHKRQQEIMKEEMVYGSKPTTPVKRRFIGTPSKTPTKLRKLDGTQTPSKFVHSSVCPSPLRPPATNRPPRPAGAVAKKVQRQKTAKTPKRISARLQAKRVLRECTNSVNNSTSSSGSSKGTSSTSSSGKYSPVTGSGLSSNRDFALVSPMSYDDFAVGLEENENCRSSIMGTRTASVISLV